MNRAADHYQDILKLYTQKRELLTPQKEFHFFLRAYKASGNKEYLPILIKGISALKKPRLEKNLAEISDPDYTFLPGTPEKKTSINSKRKQRRITFYKAYSKLTAFHRLTNSLFFLHKFRLEAVYAELYAEGIAHLKQNKGALDILLTPEGITIDSSYGANTLFHARTLGIADLVPQYLEKTREIFLCGPYAHPEKLRGANLYSAFYTLTHIIIAASDFYRRTPTEDFSWIFNYFEKHQDIALEKLSLDIQTEIALCYKIMRLEAVRAAAYEKYLSYVTVHFAADNNLSVQDFNRKEHTASIALLLFSAQDFFPDPDLSLAIAR